MDTPLELVALWLLNIDLPEGFWWGFPHFSPWFNECPIFPIYDADSGMPNGDYAIPLCTQFGEPRSALIIFTAETTPEEFHTAVETSIAELFAATQGSRVDIAELERLYAKT